MIPEDLYKTQAALEGLRLDSHGYLERSKDMPGESGPPARVVAVDYGHRQCMYFGSGIDRQLEERIRRLSVQALVEGDRRVFDILHEQKPVVGHAQYWTYTVSNAAAIPPTPMAQRLDRGDERLRGFSDGFYGAPYADVFAVFVNVVVAAAAVSSREDEAAAELWVYTRPEHRRQGFAAQAAAAWLRGVTNRGLIPFYSHARENEASRRLAESLRLCRCFVVTCYP